jgi:hypothetical protein
MKNTNNIASVANHNFLDSHKDKMDFLAAVRTEVGLDKDPVDTLTDEAPAGKYVTEYTFGTI